MSNVEKDSGGKPTEVALFPNLVQYKSYSMSRYARELHAALASAKGDQWNYQLCSCTHAGCIAGLVPGSLGGKLAERLGRLIKYPILASGTKADVYHILDHSHAHLGLVLKPGKTVVTCHDLIPVLGARGEIPIDVASTTRALLPLLLGCLRRAAAVIAISESTKRDLIRLARIPEERIHVIPYGLNSSFSAADSVADKGGGSLELRAKLGIPLDAKVMLHVSTPVPYKNTQTILRALGHLRSAAECSDSVWLLRVGSDFSESEKLLARGLGVKERIVYAGYANSDAALAEFYRAADVFVFPSLYEGFGWPPLEAMACGVPVVTSGAASLPEVVGDCGLMLSSPEDHLELGRCIARVLSDRELQNKMIANGLGRAKSFTWERAALSTLTVYRRVVDEQRNPGRFI